MISILIVDDETLIRDTLVHHINWEELGIAYVYEAKDGAQALSMIQQQPPSILLTDIKMPHMNGVELARSALELFPDISLVFLSGHTDKEYLKEAIHLHADGYIEKPLNLTEITETISSLVQKCWVKQQHRQASIYFFGKKSSDKGLNSQYFHLTQATLQQFRQSLKSKNRSTALREIQSILNSIRQCEATPPVYVRNIFTQFAAQVQNAATLCNVNQTLSECNRYINGAENAPSLEILEQGLLHIVNLFFDESASFDLNPISAVNEYIQKNYANSTITVEQIAADLFFNTSYLCTIYKQHTGTTINQALARCSNQSSMRIIAQLRSQALRDRRYGWLSQRQVLYPCFLERNRSFPPVNTGGCTMNRIKSIFENAKLRTKFILIFVILLIVPFCVFIFYSTGRIQTTTQNQTLTTAQKTFDETFASIESYLNQMDIVLDTVLEESLIYQMTSTDPKEYSVFLQYGDYLTLTSKLSLIQNLSEVDNIRLYIGDDYIYSNNKLNFYSLSQIQDSTWYHELRTYPYKQWFTPLDYADQPEGDQDYFSYARLYSGAGISKDTPPVLRVDVSSAVMKQAMSYTTITDNSIMLLMAENDIVLSAYANPELSLPDEALELLSELAEISWETIKLSGKNHYVFRSSFDANGWKLATIIPYSDINSVSKQLSLEMSFVMVALVSIALILAILLINYTLKRIGLLSAAMRQVEDGNMDIQFSSTSKDELGQLTACFNHMTKRIRQLMDEKVQYGLDIKNLELKALQAQINPHFLYNTLDTVNCLAIQNNIPVISDVVSALASFYKISLSKGRNHIKIRDEITHAKMYMMIQNIRFNNQINVTWDISPEIENLSVIKLILQPIMENAAIHGIYERKDSCGNIWVKGWLEGENVYFSVSDDGVGMTPEIISANFLVSSAEISDPSSGYGIRNINDRLRIAYGAEYGLTCESILNVGTKVIIHIPKNTNS